MRKGQKRCDHRFKGLYGKYVVRLKHTRDGFILWQQECQIKGCSHWKTTQKYICKITFHKHNKGKLL